MARAYNKVRTARYGCLDDLTEAQWLTIKTECGGICTYCGRKANMTLDHRIPLSLGGHHTAENVVPCCWICNSHKACKTDEQYRQWIAIPENMARVHASPINRPKLKNSRERGLVPDAYITVPEASQLFGCSVGNVHAMIRAGKLDAGYHTRAPQMLLDRASAERYKHECRRPGRPPMGDGLEAVEIVR